VSKGGKKFEIEPQKDFLKKILGQALVTPLFDRERFFLKKIDRDYLLKEKKPENIIQRINDITKYHTSKIMFLIDVDIENMTGITPIGRKYSICFGENISGTTMAHEFLHSLNLLEVFDGDVKKKKIGNNILSPYNRAIQSLVSAGGETEIKESKTNIVKTGGKLYIAGEYSILTAGQSAIIKNINISIKCSIIYTYHRIVIT